MHVLVTGNAGFIGFHTARRLLQRGDSVVGFDVVNDYYDPALKEARLRELEDVARITGSNYRFVRGNLADAAALQSCFDASRRFDRVIHLAAQAGIRYSTVNPQAYVESNVTGFVNVLEACRHQSVPHLTYASTSSVYGANTSLPYRETMSVDHPLQFYAATKRANELMAHAYSHLWHLPMTGLRFFTVYGPWGRPDMALSIFAKHILEGTPLPVFNNGHHSRDFTFIDDIVEGVIRASDQIATADPQWHSDTPTPATSAAPWRVLNIGNSSPVPLMEYIRALEAALGHKAKLEMLPGNRSDAADTHADVSALREAVDWQPATPIDEGVRRFAEWFRAYHGK